MRRTRTTYDITRSEAAEILNEIRKKLFEHKQSEGVDLGQFLDDLFTERSIPILFPCPGDAHDPEVGGQIDNCGSCLNSFGWGVVGATIRVR